MFYLLKFNKYVLDAYYVPNITTWEHITDQNPCPQAHTLLGEANNYKYTTLLLWTNSYIIYSVTEIYEIQT